MGPVQTFDASWHYDNGFDFVDDVTIFTILSIDMVIETIITFYTAYLRCVSFNLIWSI